jgi:uncharacterized protein (UPF0179 family)
MVLGLTKGQRTLATQIRKTYVLCWVSLEKVKVVQVRVEISEV